MQFSEITTELKDLNFDSLRVDCDNYFEAVVNKERVTELAFKLERHLGNPVWPSKTRLSYQVEEIIRNYGGIMSGQTLYFRSLGIDAIFVMLWPWKDGIHTTIKVVRK